MKEAARFNSSSYGMKSQSAEVQFSCHGNVLSSNALKVETVKANKAIKAMQDSGTVQDKPT